LAQFFRCDLRAECLYLILSYILKIINGYKMHIGFSCWYVAQTKNEFLLYLCTYLGSLSTVRRKLNSSLSKGGSSQHSKDSLHGFCVVRQNLWNRTSKTKKLCCV
jgi:hypothetical protein